ncbi:MAG: hypothetical protein ACIAQF_11850 [Phycisphaerales bacterium JB065]
MFFRRESRRLPAITGLIAAIGLVVTGSAQAQPVPTDQPLQQELGERVDFDIALGEGDVFAYRTRMNLRIEQEIADGDLTSQVLSYDVTSRFTVQGVDDEGVATVSMKVIDATITIADGDEQTELKVGQLADGEQYGSPFAAAIANTVVTLVISPDGLITSVLGAEDYQAALDATDGADPRQIGFFSAEQIREIYEPLFTIEELNGKPRRVGTGWATSRVVELPPVAVIDLDYTWKFQGMLEEVATMTSRVVTNIRRPSTPDPARPTIAIEGSSGNVVTQWNRELQRVTRRISTLSLDTRWTLGELELTQKQQSSVRIESVPVTE